MSMIGCFYSLKDEDLEVLISTPEYIQKLWDSKPLQDGWVPSEKAIAFDVDKAWQGIHFLLTGSDWEGDGPLAFILHGGREIAENLGYGSPHGFTSVEVRAIDDALQKINADALCEQADPAKFAELELYPQIWDREPKQECVGYVIEHLKALQKFVGETAKTGRGLIAYLG
jgi:hypothetical protein